LPNHPSYPSNHACDSGAAAEVLATYFPSSAAELRAMAREAGESRIDGGIHYRFDLDAGLAIGRAAAAAALAALGPTDAIAGVSP
jgi:membrane-associated phospholipid phosphatase